MVAVYDLLKAEEVILEQPGSDNYPNAQYTEM